MDKHLVPCILILLFCIYSLSLSAQQSKEIFTDRYIEINDIDSFFNIDESADLVVCSFELVNIFEEESSKPVFAAVNDINGVVDFSIKSRSERYVNQRSCFLKMRSQNYLSTFRIVLDRMEVNFITYKGNLISVNDFYSKSL